jgi:hypothetical protein
MAHLDGNQKGQPCQKIPYNAPGYRYLQPTTEGAELIPRVELPTSLTD